ncbi:hypothetical protein TNCV_5043281 [Trichonephila clavipes]|nr:hypothetical protein TNCV_5043281 [Trichonephila clavipes]
MVLGGGLRITIILPRVSQGCSIGLRSTDLVGRLIWQISSFFRNSLTRWALCGFVASSIEMKSGPSAPVKRWTDGFKTSSLYLTAVTEPLSTT